MKGATETRITWEGQAAADESVKGITLTMPEGTSFSTKNARITMLSGSDLMTRTNIAANFQIQGDSIVATFDEAAPAGGYFRFEVYEVKFPASGGAMDLTAPMNSRMATTRISDRFQLLTSWVSTLPKSSPPI